MSNSDYYAAPETELIQQEEVVEILNPLKTLWTQPRATARYLAKHASLNSVFVIIGVYLAITLVLFFINQQFASEEFVAAQNTALEQLGQSLWVYTVLGAFAGILGFYVLFPACISLAADWFAGTINTRINIIVFAWFQIPTLVAGLAFPLLEIVFTGQSLNAAASFSANMDPISLVLAGVSLLVWLYAFVLYLLGLSAAANFSVGRAFGSTLVGGILGFLVILAVSVVIALVASAFFVAAA